MNTFNKYLPSLKDREGSPTKLVRGNELFKQLELCNIILTAPLFNFASIFWTVKGTNHFPVYVNTLKVDLQLIEPTYNETAKLVAQVKSTKGMPTITPKKGNDPKKCKLSDRIPRKTKPKGSGGDTKSQPDKKQVLYQVYTNWSKSSMYTHAIGLL